MIRNYADRFQKTYEFVSRHLDPKEPILDLGTSNDLSKYLTEKGFDIQNTGGENLDLEYEKFTDTGIKTLTAFEIFEHMLAPFNILYHTKAERLIASVPLKLWFVDAYWNDENDWDKHYHEFESRQFDFLLKQTGWKIVASEKWVAAPKFGFGVRPLLRRFYPRYYIVYCEREQA